MLTICLEPGSRFFRVKDSEGSVHRYSSFLVSEALTGDGIVLPEDFEQPPGGLEVAELFPWGGSGGIRNFDLARAYLRLLGRKFSPTFRRTRWRVILSPSLIAKEGQGWIVLLREAAIRRFELIDNLSCLSKGGCRQTPAAYLHWGASGGDLGLCVHNETYAYRRLVWGESFLVQGLMKWFKEVMGSLVSELEAYRILKIVGELGLASCAGSLLEVSLIEQGSAEKLSVEQEQVQRAILELMQPLLESVEGFIKDLSAEEQGQLFQQGLKLSGSLATLKLLNDYLEEIFEFPVATRTRPEEAVLLEA